MIHRLPWAFGLLIAAGLQAAGDELHPIVTNVSYVSGQTIYLGAGSARGLETGDSLQVFDGAGAKGLVIITAVSSSSSAARALDSTLQVSPGDSARTLRLHASQGPPVRASEAASLFRTAPETSRPVLHGRIAAQMFASRSLEEGWDILQPSVLLRLDLSRILGSDLSFSFFGRTSRDFSAAARGPSGYSETMLRLYDMSLRYGATEGWFGIGIGRITSRHVAGLGAFDGGELLLRLGRLTVGVLGGGQPDYRTSAVDPDRRKIAGYVNMRLGDGPWSRNDVTVAYGRQFVRGTLDRDFLYLQTSLTPVPRMFLYQSTEVDFHDLEGGESKQNLHLTNTFVTLSWIPNDWLSTNAGYDAARPVILLESMKEFSDTLLDRDLQQGVRASATVRLPMRLSVTLNGGFRFQSEIARQAHSYGGAFRAADLGGSGVSASIQYLRARALYTEGNDVTFFVESWITRWITASIRYNRYAYVLTGSSEGSVATTLSLAASFRLTGSWYALTNFDRLWDPGRSGYRMLAELSFHF